VFSWSIGDKNCHSVRCFESDSFQGYVSIYASCEDDINEEEEWAKISTDRKKIVVF
jgi:hypothetical protein